MTNFYSFVIGSQSLTDIQGAGIDGIKPLIENFEECIYNLKKSVHTFEQFDKRFEEILNKDAGQIADLDLTELKQKLFVDEVFGLKLGTGEVIPQDLQFYDIKQNHANEQFLKNLFKMPPSILPV